MAKEEKTTAKKQSKTAQKEETKKLYIITAHTKDSNSASCTAYFLTDNGLAGAAFITEETAVYRWEGETTFSRCPQANRGFRVEAVTTKAKAKKAISLMQKENSFEMPVITVHPVYLDEDARFWMLAELKDEK